MVLGLWQWVNNWVLDESGTDLLGSSWSITVSSCEWIKHISDSPEIADCAGVVKHSSVPTTYPRYLFWKMLWPKKQPRRASVWRSPVVRTAVITWLTLVIYSLSFSALTLLVGHQEEHPACKNWVMRCCCGCLSGARCRLFAHGPSDAFVSPNLIISCLI